MFFFTDSHENSHAVGTRFHYFPVIVGQPNLVSSFLTIFPRVVFRNIPEKSNPPLRKNCWNSAILTFIWSALGTIYPYFPVIVGQPNLASSFLTSFPRVVFRNSSEYSNPPLRKNCWNSAILTFIWSALGTWDLYFPVIIGEPHLVSRFLTSFPRVLFWNIPEKSNTHPRNKCRNSAILPFFGLHLVQWYPYFPVIVGRPHLVPSFL